ncbi:MAG: HEAT repeat domain-containing protein [Victivallales bacterium]|nr:HEAT repeat domain-containing protein [Victivallales bacterium]
MKLKVFLLISAIVIVLLVAFFTGVHHRHVEQEEPFGVHEPIGETIAPIGTPEPTSPSVVVDAVENDAGGELLASKDAEVQRLQDFLDENDADGILEQAAFLAESDDTNRREAAIDALIWLSSPKAGKVLIPLLKDSDPDISQQAFNGMLHVLNTLAVQISEDVENGELLVGDGADEIMSEENLRETYDLWVAACLAVDDVDALENLLIGLSGVDVKLAVPALVDIVEGSQGALREKAAEYLDITTNRDGVTNREEAALWLMEQAGKN